MPDYTFSVTPEEDNAITARRTAESPLILDNQTYITTVVKPRILGEALRLFIETRVQRVVDSYRAGTATQRTNVDRSLGL